jgi:hypothetical protein
MNPAQLAAQNQTHSVVAIFSGGNIAQLSDGSALIRNDREYAVGDAVTKAAELAAGASEVGVLDFPRHLVDSGFVQANSSGAGTFAWAMREASAGDIVYRRSDHTFVFSGNDLLFSYDPSKSPYRSAIQPFQPSTNDVEANNWSSACQNMGEKEEESLRLSISRCWSA